MTEEPSHATGARSPQQQFVRPATAEGDRRPGEVAGAWGPERSRTVTTTTCLVLRP